MRIFALTAYEGAPFAGWQIQINATTVQHVIERALFIATKRPTRIIGSSRTDAGVHALGQVFHCDLDDSWSERLPILQRSLNGLLPGTVRILELQPVSAEVHAQFSARRKTYDYYLHTHGVELPFDSPYRTRVPPLDLSALRAAASCLEGERDFKALSNSGRDTASTIRTLFAIDITSIPGGLRLSFTGNGFLYKMVRNGVGLLLEVALGKRPVAGIEELLAMRRRAAGAPAAPARGLFLRSIEFEPEVTWQSPHWRYRDQLKPSLF